VTQFNDQDDQYLVFDQAKDPVIADAVPPQLLLAERLSKDAGIVGAMHPLGHEAHNGPPDLLV